MTHSLMKISQHPDKSGNDNLQEASVRLDDEKVKPPGNRINRELESED